MPLTSRFRGMFYYIAIGLLVVFAAILWATYVPPKVRVDGKWEDLAVGTVFVFGFLARAYWRHHRKSMKLWGLLGLFFLLHVIVFRFLLKSTGPWSLVRRVGVFTAEFMFICAAVYWTLGFLPQLDPLRRHDKDR